MISTHEIKAQDTYAIRKAILREGMTLSHKMSGDQDDSTLHLGVFDKGALVCIGSFMKVSKDGFKGLQYQLRGMASAEGCQGKGYGKLLMKRAEELLVKNHVDLIWCNARVPAIEFYQKLGYSSIGEIFKVDQIGPHIVMYKYL